MSKYIVIPDSFKGSLTSQEFCEIAKTEILKFEPHSKVLTFPVGDGGEGTADCFLKALNGSTKINISSFDPYNNKIDTYYVRKDNKAIIESAKCCGLELVKNSKSPLKTSTFGVGVMIKKAIEDGCREILLGLGCSSTCDCGTGLCSALGVTFKDKNGKGFIPVGETLKDITSIDTHKAKELLNEVKISAMCDVKNPLYGENGASYVFSPQKGASPVDVQRLDSGLQHVAKVINKNVGIDVQKIIGGGACGGVGAGISSLLGAELVSGIDLILKALDFEKELSNTDLVITGEGQIDSQSKDGKAISGIAKLSKKHNVPCLCLVGAVGNGAESLYEIGVSSIFSIGTKIEPLFKAKLHAKANLTFTINNIFRLKNSFN